MLRRHEASGPDLARMHDDTGDQPDREPGPARPALPHAALRGHGARARATSGGGSAATWCPPTGTIARVLKLLQWRCPPTRWNLKSPPDICHLDAFVAVYPDARIVWTHRDPAKVLPSVCKLIAIIRALFSERRRPARARPRSSWRSGRRACAAASRSAAASARRASPTSSCTTSSRSPIETVAAVYDALRPCRSPPRPSAACAPGSPSNPQHKHGAPSLHAGGVRARRSARCATPSATTRSTSTSASKPERSARTSRMATRQEKDAALGAQLIAERQVARDEPPRAPSDWAQGSGGGAARRQRLAALRRASRRSSTSASRRRSRRATPADRARTATATSACWCATPSTSRSRTSTPTARRFDWLDAAQQDRLGLSGRALRHRRRSATTRSIASRGRRGTVHFLGLQVMAGIRSLHNTSRRRVARSTPDGSFEIDRRRAGASSGNWIPLDARRRHDLDAPVLLRLGARDAGVAVDRPHRRRPARRSRSGLLDPGFLARRLDAVATNVEANVDLWLGTALALRERYCNVFPTEAFGGTADGRAEAPGGRHLLLPRRATTRRCCSRCTPPRAKYWSIDLCNFWLESLDYANHQSSLNGHQAVVDADGVFRAVVAHRDPGVPNWLDTGRPPRGLDDLPLEPRRRPRRIRSIRIVPLADLAPASAPRHAARDAGGARAP